MQGAFYHGLRGGFTVFIQQMFFQRSRIHPNPDGAIVIFGGLNDLAHAIFGPDIAWIDAQAFCAGLRGF